MALGNVTSHFSTMLEPMASASFLSSLSVIHEQTDQFGDFWNLRLGRLCYPAPYPAPVKRELIPLEKSGQDVVKLEKTLKSAVKGRMDSYGFVSSSD